VTEANKLETPSNKVTKMLQAALGLTLKCVDMQDQFFIADLDLACVSKLAADVEASSTAARAKSVQQAAVRLKHRIAGTGKPVTKTAPSAKASKSKSSEKPPATDKAAVSKVSAVSRQKLLAPSESKPKTSEVKQPPKQADSSAPKNSAKKQKAS